MQIETGVVLGFIAAAGAGWRAFKGYQAHMSKRTYETFSLKKFLISVVPATAAGFMVGADLESMPNIMSTDGLIMAMMLFTGGAGFASLQGKLPFSKVKK